MIGGNVRMRAVAVTTQPTLAFGNPVPVAKPAFWIDSTNDVARQYDIMPDGQKFVGIIGAGTAGSTETGAHAAPLIQVVLNWFEELKARVPTK